ncbi:aminotransferase class I/II-fold pyridoxal phosphate-dependent enzyme [Nocardioides maradonensis]
MDFSSIAEALDTRGRSSVRWCTPSLNPSLARVHSPYDSDASISFESFGLPLEPTGLFKHAFDKAARAFGADQTLFSVNGTTWSNYVVIKALAKQAPNLRILASRNVHRSVVSACEDYGVRLMFLPTRMHERFHTFIPNTTDEVLEGVARTKPQVLLLTTPTYEGLAADLADLIRKVRRLDPRLVVFIDEAWGAHLHFSSLMPLSAMAAGADICVQSTHKQGGSLQQTGMIHWQGDRIDADLLRDAYRTLGTSSPSYLLMASLEAATHELEQHGEDHLDRMVELAQLLTKSITSIPEYDVAEIHEANHDRVDRDATKVVVDVSRCGLSGYEVARQLELDHAIVVEAYNINTVLLLVPFNATMDDIEATREALAVIASERRLPADVHLRLPRNVPKVLDLTEVSRLLPDQLEDVPLHEAVGRICGEHITPFPPGIPTTIKGEELTDEMVAYYDQLRAVPNLHIAARDPRLGTVCVVR